jgi:signal peptidase I
MPSPQDPWLAANLSLSMAGLGQLYAGRRLSGILFLSLDLLGIGAYILWLVSRDFSTLPFLWAIGGLFLLRIVSLIHAHAVTRNLATASAKNPWRSFFMTRFIPGLGHAYARRWIRAIAFFLLFLVWSSWTPTKERETLVYFLSSVVGTLVLLDSFRTLRQGNGVPSRTTWIALLFFLGTSQTFVIAKGLQLIAYEVFRIPSSSMEPTLLGNVSSIHPLEACPFRSSHETSSGDRILVSKLAYLASPVERFDLVVFRFPLDQAKTQVKRVVGMPGEQIQIHQGDLYARVSEMSPFRIVRKPLATQDAIWIRADGSAEALSSSGPFRQQWDPVLGGPGSSILETGILNFKGSSDTSFRWRVGIDDAAGHDVEDVRLSLDGELSDAKTIVFAERANHYGRFGVRIGADGSGVLSIDGPKGKKDLPLTYPALKPGERFTLDLLVYDGAAIARLNGVILAQENFIDVLEDGNSVRRQTLDLSFGMKGGPGRVFRLDVGRDIHYRGRNRDLAIADDAPVAIPEGSYLLLGDNVANSHDSRGWVKRSFHLKDGRTIVCEDQQIIRSYSSDFLRHLQEKDKLPNTPDFGIDGDEHGNEVGLFNDQILRADEPEPFRFIERRYIQGRVQKVWWPLSRARAVR